MGDKTYAGNGKIKRFQDGGSVINLVIDLEGLWMASKQNKGVFVTSQGRKKIKLCVNERRSADQYGNTHSVSIDEFVPDSNAKKNNGWIDDKHDPASPQFDDSSIPF